MQWGTHIFPDPMKTNRERDIQWLEMPAIALAVSWSGVIAGTLVLFRLGVPIGPWHSLFWLLCYFAFLELMARSWYETPLRGFPFGFGMIRGIPILLLALGSIFVSTQTFDFSVDGLSTHQDPVVALVLGWNPIVDPYFSETAAVIGSRRISPEWVFGSPQGGCSLSFSYLSAAIFGALTGNHESGKAINMMVFPMVFGFAFGASRRLGLSRLTSLFFSVAVAANPVALYQSSSFLQDGLVSSFYACFMLYSLSWLSGSVPKLSILICSSLAFVLAGLKLSGLGFAGLGLLFLGVGALSLKRMRVHEAFLWGVLSSVVVLVAGESSRYWAVSSIVEGSVSNRVSHFSSEVVVEGGGGFGQVKGMSRHNKLTQFILSQGSYSHPSPTRSDLKPLFKVTWDEIMVFYRLVGEPRAGGFGPLGSGIILLSMFSLLCCWERRVLSFKPVWIVVVMALAPLFFVPVFWARWIGHVWVLFFIVAIPVLGIEVRADSGGVRSLPVIRIRSLLAFGRLSAHMLILAGMINALVVGIPYVLGHISSAMILRAQMEVFQKIDHPVTAYIGWSRACRFWMLRNGVTFNRNYLVGVPYSRLFMAESRVFLPDEVLEAEFDSTRTIHMRLLEIQDLSLHWQPGQLMGEVLYFP